MPHVWPEDTDFALWELDVLDRDCPACGRMMHICDHRYRHFYTLDGPVELVCKLNHCPDPRCPGHARTRSPEVEPTIALPGWGIAWDVFCWIGHRRFSRHWSIPQIRGELHDRFAIDLTEPGIANYIRRYQAMLAARQQDPEALRRHYQGTEALILSIDGLQPEKGHETLYVVRELTGKRVWFAEALLSATAAEVQRLIARAKQWADALGKPVALWVSDKQDAFVTGIAAEFPGVPHRYCANHFLRDLARPVLEADSHAKVQMRRKVRGLRGIERSVLKRRRASAPEGPPAAVAVTAPDDPAGDVVLDVLRRGPRHPQQRPGRPAPPARAGDERRADGGEAVARAEPGREKGGFAEAQLSRLAACIDKGLDLVKPEQEAIRRHVATIREVAATLDPATGRSAARQGDFDAILSRLEGDGDPVHEHMANLMGSFRAGLFAGGDDLASVQDNLDLERWFRVAKGHERRIHGHRHAGVRVVQEGGDAGACVGRPSDPPRPVRCR